MSFDAQRAMPERVPKRDFTEISSIAFCEQLSQQRWGWCREGRAVVVESSAGTIKLNQLNQLLSPTRP
jgi:hypothetical protein